MAGIDWKNLVKISTINYLTRYPMRQVNFAIIFIFCLAFALFSIENTELGTIHLIPGMEVQAPISVELLIALGSGGILAWFPPRLDSLRKTIMVWSKSSSKERSNSTIRISY